MKQYKKPMMKIVELEKVDVLTCSLDSTNCKSHIHHSECINDEEPCGCTYGESIE